MTTRPVLVALLLALGLLTPVVSHADAPAAPQAAAAAAAKQPPNVVLIMTDDMTAADLQWMPRTRRLFLRSGTSFRDAIAPNPVCCPARATVLTGQDSHNNGVWSNTEPHGGYAGLQPGVTRLPEWLQDAGYRTAFLGKHLNGFRAEEASAEPGWDVLDALVAGVYSYRSFTAWNDGDPEQVRHGYVTDYLRDGAERVIRHFDRRDRTPFFLWVSNVGPHNARTTGCTGGGCWSPPRPAERDLGSFDRVPSPTRSLTSYNHRNGATKPPFLRDLGRLRRSRVDLLFQRRIESLQSVDRSVADIVRTLRDRDELDRTLLVFTSDNGYLLGQHRYVGKRLPYEESLRVPLLMRGPGVPARTRVQQTATTSDLSRTIVDLAGAEPSHPLDGVSLLPALSGGDTGRGASIVQTGAAVDPEGDGQLGEQPDDHGWLYRGYRDERWTYARYPDPSGPDTPAFEELYDRHADPGALRNLATDPAYADVLDEARRRAAELAVCAGESCHPAWPPIPLH